MANWQVISLDTTTPQLRAPGTGDGYSFNSGSTQLGVWTTTGLGIGTASPAAKLDIVDGVFSVANTATSVDNTIKNLTATGTTGETTGISFDVANNANGVRIYAQRDGTYGSAGTRIASFRVATTTGGVESEKFVISGDGNVGIGTGTTSPSSFLYNGLVVGDGTGNIGLTLFSNSTGIGSIAFADGSSGAARYAGHLRYLHSSNAFTFDTEDVERMRLNSTGLGIGTTSPAAKLHVAAGNILIDNNRAVSAFDNAGTQETLISISTANNVSVSAPTLSGSLDFNIRNSTGSHRFFSGGSERARIDSSGRLLVGGTTAFGSANGSIEVSNTSGDQILATRFVNGTGGPQIALQKSRGGLGVNTIVADGDTLGLLYFYGANGTGYSGAAYIQAAVDGTPGASADMPGRLVFATSADGSATPAERARITSAGELLVGGTSTLPSLPGGITANCQLGVQSASGGYIGVFRNDTSVFSGNTIGGLIAYGNDTTTNTVTPLTYILSVASGDHAAGDNPTDITFGTTPDNSETVAERARITNAGSVVVNTAAVATTATDGFLYIPTCAGAPTGVPTTFTGRSPLVVDSTNNRFYVYVNGAWKYATLT